MGFQKGNENKRKEKTKMGEKKQKSLAWRAGGCRVFKLLAGEWVFKSLCLRKEEKLCMRNSSAVASNKYVGQLTKQNPNISFSFLFQKKEFSWA